MQTIAAAHQRVVTRPATQRRVRTTFYLWLTAFMVAVVLVGFWPSYFGKLIRGDIARPAVIQVHGLIFVGWMALLVAQVLLVVRGRTDWHRKVGQYGIAYGWLVIAMGLIVGPAASIIHIRSGEWTRDEGAGFLLLTFGDMALFGSLFAAAVWYRRQPEIHKRLMLGATVALLFAAVGRMSFLESTQGLAGAVWLSPMVIGMGYDWFSKRRVHPAYVIATIVLFIGGTRVLFQQSPAWLAIARPIIGALM